MERSRDLRRSSMATSSSNGILRRKHKSDEGRVRKRDRDRERERETNSSSRSKRTREERHRTRDFVPVVGEEDEEESVAAAAVALTDGSSSSSSFQHHNHHKRMLPPPSNAASSSYHHHNSSNKSFSRPSTVFKAAADEMIGVPVPRKARSVSVKRPHENRTSSASGGGGVVGGDEKMNRSSRKSGEVVDSPSCSTVSTIRKKLKIKTSDNQASNSGNSSSAAVQEDIEFEIAEVLFGMKKQSSIKPDAPADSSQKPETKSSCAAATGKSGSSNSSALENPSDMKRHASVLALNAHTASDPSRGDALKRENVAAEITGDKAVSGTKVDSEQSSKMLSSSSKLDNVVSKPDLEAGEASGVKVAAKDSCRSVDMRQNIEQDSMKLPRDQLGAQDKIDSEAKLAPMEKKSTVQFFDSALRKENLKVSEVGTKKVEKKFEIDLNDIMATPTPSSPERDSLYALESDSIAIKKEIKVMQNSDTFIKGEKMQTAMKKESAVKEYDDKKKVAAVQKTKLGIEILDQQTQAAIPKGEKTSEYTMLPSAVAVAGWPDGLPPMGYLPPLPTVLPIDGKTGSSAALKPPEFHLCQPRPKRCATHQYIARNIDLHQKFIKMTQYWPAAAGSAALSGMKPNIGNNMPSSGNMVFGTPLQGSGPSLCLNLSQEKGNAATTVEKDKSCEAHFVQKNQLSQQRAQQPAAANNIMHGPPFGFPPVNNQQSVPATPNQTAASKSATSTKNTSSSTSAASRPPTGSSPLPASVGTVSFGLPNMAGNEAQFLAILQNNGYPFPITTPVGTAPALKLTSGQPLPFCNGSFYSPHLFHPPQLQQQHSQPTALSAPPNTSMQTGSSSSNKQPQDQLQKAQISGSGFSTSKNLHFQQQPKKHNGGPLNSHSQKFEADVNGENVSSFAASRPPQVQKNIYGQNITVPMQPVNFTLMPSTMAGNGSEKHQAVEFIPSQTFTMPFASFGGNTMSPNLNFSSMAQNPSLVKGLQGVAQSSYQVAPAQTVHHKSFQISQGKNGSESNSADSGKKAVLGKTATSTGQTLVFDNSSKTLNFMSSPVTGNQASRSSTSSAIATASTVPSTSQQKQLLELQKQQPLGVPRSKTSTSSYPPSSITAKFPNNSSVYMPLIQCNTGAMASQYKNPVKTSTPQVTSLPVSATSALKNLPQQGRASSQVITHISFGQQTATNSQPPQPLLGKQHANSYQPPQPLSGNQPASGNLRTGSKSSNVSSSPATQSQQTDNSSTNGKKSSPVCGRNVPSVISNGPGHISDVKYQSTAN